MYRSRILVGPAGQAPQTFNDRTEAVTQRLKLSRPGGNVPAGSDISSEHMRNLEEKGNKSSAKKGSASVDVGTLPVQWSVRVRLFLVPSPF